MTASTQSRSAGRRAMRPGQALALGFLVLILLGGLTLSLPAASATGRSLGLLKGMFTATSAVCVTGLTLVEAGRDLTLFGQAILLTLIQIGGLGFMAFATLSMVLLGRRVSLRNRMMISESMNQSGLSGMVRLALYSFAMALTIELSGAAVLAIRFIPVYGVGKGLWFSVFHAISAFCNAGFDLLGQGVSLVPYQKDGLVMLTLSGLIVLGSMGFSVLLEIGQRHKSSERLSLHSRLALTMTGALLVLGTGLVLWMEWGNTLNDSMTFPQKLLNSFFQAVTCRTAGFAAIDQGALNDSTKLLSCVLMFIGASPASTGGGVKTTTFLTVLLLVATVIRGRERITVFGREIGQEQATRAMALVAIALGCILAVTGVISALERQTGASFIDLAYEATSAMTTTGLSAVGTGALRQSSQILLMPLMYIGRVGPLSLAVALAARAGNGAANRVRHPEEKIMIG